MGLESKAAAKAKIEADRKKLERKEKLTRFTPSSIGFGIIGIVGLPATVFIANANRERAEANAMQEAITGGYAAQSSAETATSSLDSVGPAQMLVDTASSGDSFFMFALAGVVTILIGVVTAFKVRAANAPEDETTFVDEKTKTVTSYTAQWAALMERKNELIVKWSRYETDVALMIDYPIMTDYTDPVVGKVITAMQKMRNAEMLTVDQSTAPVFGSAMLTAVNNFEFALTAAEKYARRYGQTKLDPREQRKLSAARQALNIILDEQAPAHEVEAAYKSLRSSLRGIIDIPQQAVIELESKVRREITVSAL